MITGAVIRDVDRAHDSGVFSGLHELVTSDSLIVPSRVLESTWHEHAPFGFWLVEALQPRCIVELGTDAGFSFFVFREAAARNPHETRLIGIRPPEESQHGGPPRYEAEAELDMSWRVKAAVVSASFADACDRFAPGEIDVLHIAGLREYEEARFEFERWRPKLSGRSVVLLDNVGIRDPGFGMWVLMEELRGQFRTFEFSHGRGLGVIGVGTQLAPRLCALVDSDRSPELREAVRAAYATLGERIGKRHGAALLSQPALGRGTSSEARTILELRARLRAAESDGATLARTLSWRATTPLRRAAASLRQAWSAARWSVLLRFPVNLEARREAHSVRRRRERELGPDAYANWIAAYDTFDESDLDGMRKLNAKLAHPPLISVLLPVHEPTRRYLEAAIESVRSQVYENWQLCVVDDGATDPGLREAIETRAAQDDRVRLVTTTGNGGISAATNAALELAEGEIVAVLGENDLLRPHALLLVAHAFVEMPTLIYVYSDEDFIDDAGARYRHYFKPDWNRELLRSQNYVSRLSAFRADHARRVGGFRSEFDGGHDWDLALRITEHLSPDQVAHIPHVLYHRRATEPSTEPAFDTSSYVQAAGSAAVMDQLRRTRVPGIVVRAGEADQNVRYAPPDPAPLVSVVVPTTMRHGLFEAFVDCISSTPYRPIELVRVATAETMRRHGPCPSIVLASLRQIDVESADEEFNYARAVNLGCAAASGELLLIANDDLELLHPDWLEIMVGHVTQPGVGAVGPLLLLPDERVQHAGVLLGSGGAAGHLYYWSSVLDRGYANRLRLNQNLSCVTGACMLVRKEAFEAVGGFDEFFAVGFNDVDFCVRLGKAGWTIVFTPEAMLTHRESASFGSHYVNRRDEWRHEYDEMRSRLGDLLSSDPCHNPNLELDSSKPGRLAFPPRVTYPWRAGVLSRAGSERAS